MKLLKFNWNSFLKELSANFWIEDGNKHRLNFKMLGLMAVPLLFIGGWISAQDGEDTSFIAQVTGSATNEIEGNTPLAEHETSRNSLVQDQAPIQKQSMKRGPQLKYSAKQVIDRAVSSEAYFMPIGTNLIGKLLTAIDTRDEGQVIKVILPYGGTYQGERRIERNSTMFGTAIYSGRGNKVFLRFNRLLEPSGNEFQIQAQALNSKDYSPGLVGNVHTNMDTRIISAIGLSMLSAGSDVLIEREALGESFSATPKATLKNAAMAGVSKAAQMEAERRASDVESEAPYITVDAGAEMIVSLTESFRGESTHGDQK